jgi:cytochrome c
MRKSHLFAGLVAAGMIVAGPALASEQLAKDNGCMTCHDATKKKMAPSNKDLAAKYKGQADAVDKIVANIKAGKGHPPSKASEADLKAITAWMLK